MARARKRTVGYRWHLRRLMAEAGMFATTDLGPLLAERGIELSAAQVYRLVTGTPERLSLRTLVALCDILECTPAQLIEPVVENKPLRVTGTGTGAPVSAAVKKRTPRRRRNPTREVNGAECEVCGQRERREGLTTCGRCHKGVGRARATCTECGKPSRLLDFQLRCRWCRDPGE